MKINRKKFFAGYRNSFGSLNQNQVDGLEFLLSKFESVFWTNVRVVAYILATIKHEAADTFQPIKEYRSRLGSKGRVNQDRYWLTGYYGRGFVQITWRKNYEKLGKAIGADLVTNPNLALQPEIAFEILVAGVGKGLFTGKEISDYISSRKCDYLNARRVVNGTDKAALIAGYAQNFEEIRQDSLSTDKDEPRGSTPTAKTAGDAVETRAEDEQSNSALENISGEGNKPDGAQVRPDEDAAHNKAVTPAPDSNTVEVEQIKPEPQVEKQDWGIKASVAAAVTFITTSGAGVFAVMREAKTEIIYGFFGAATVVGIVFIIARFVYITKREKLESIEKMAREQRAADLQLALVNTASRRDLNTVSVVPMPVENSEPEPDEPKMFAGGVGGSW
ncbi:MAG TPA: glycoside hydrolase family 19 protein [Pyrinomonadaceae bacterium]|nr:glycoside hydrolase family 19 protein [Pyrinomonadaceae bacterium]